VGQARIKLQVSSHGFQQELERLLAVLARLHRIIPVQSTSGHDGSQGRGIAEAHFILAAQLRRGGVLMSELQNAEGEI
jgi:hypothetical protein